MTSGIGTDNGFPIGTAIAMMKRGAKVTWTGLGGEWIALRRGYPEGVPADEATARDLGITLGAR